MSDQMQIHFCHCFLQDFSIEIIWKCYVKNYFKINGKQMIKVSKKGKILDTEIMKEKQNHNLWFMQILKVF